MKNLFLAIAWISICSTSCTSTSQKELQSEEKEPYLRWVGDIEFDEKTDDPDFQLCYTDNDIRQYFNFSKGVQYKGGKPALIQYFKENYIAVKSDQSGLLRIRFIVNCKGETGRFRLTGMNPDYQPMEFDKSITDQILTLTKEMDGWLPIEMEEMNNTRWDYYQYLIFKIDRGNIIEIMP